jgi:hypothetical protein
MFQDRNVEMSRKKSVRTYPNKLKSKCVTVYHENLVNRFQSKSRNSNVKVYRGNSAPLFLENSV